MRPLIPALALLALGSSALAGPKPPASAMFEPEIGYTYASGNYMDLRLANRAGDMAILVHRTGFGKLRSFDLADENAKRIAYNDDTRLYAQQWSTQGGVPSIVGEPDLIFDGPGMPEIPDFSPDGGKLAFSVLSPSEPGIRLYDFSAPTTGSVLALGGYSVFTVRWHPDGQSIYFSGYPSGTTDPKRLFRLYLATGSVVRVSSAENFGFGFDVGRGGAAIKPLLALDNATNLDFYALDGTPAGFGLLRRSLARFNCGNTALIARNLATRKQSVSIQSGAQFSQQETWSIDPNIHHTDWMRRVPCV